MRNIPDCIPQLERLGVSVEDAYALRRIAMTLHSWHERECGCVERDEVTGKPYMNLVAYKGEPAKRYYVPDLEKGSLKRLEKIMDKYDGCPIGEYFPDTGQLKFREVPHLRAYVQTDPRGAALYIVKASDVPPGGDIESYYTRGVAVYK